MKSRFKAVAGCKLALLSAFAVPQSVANAQEQPSVALPPGYRAIFGELLTLESKSDPKCHATASRLENFVYGTPLSDEARFEKNRLAKALVTAAWIDAASHLAEPEAEIDTAAISRALSSYPEIEKSGKGWRVTLPGSQLSITERDKRQYSSIAYSLRAILGAQQELGLAPDAQLPALTEDAIKTLKEATDVYQLAVLQISDRAARAANEPEISAARIAAAWKALELPLPVLTEVTGETAGFRVLRQIIAQKIAAYAAYNEISNQIFVRNLQVYFARRRWPADPADGAKLKSYVSQAITNFAVDLYQGADALARKRQDHLLRERDVSAFAQQFVAHRINEYEDAIFFPNLDRSQQVTIESYDMDSFRDSGLHWRYLQFALEDPSFSAQLEADPFAAELLAENIAQFGVLMLRVAGEEAIREGRERLAPSDIEAGLRVIQKRISAHANASPRPEGGGEIVSSASTAPSREDGGGKALFAEVSSSMGIHFSHRSSDWLNRQMRSYIKTGRDTGTMTIPPAFGGAGIAAEDVNHDDWPDLLVLSGLGNRLYLNDGGRSFVDFTAQSGISWLRPEDNHPGEPRQPIIADFDNDGHQDVFISYVNDPHRLYRGRGDGTFEDVTDRCGLGGKGLVGGPATTFDFDRDGRLDIFIGYFGDYLKGVLPTLERRNRNGLPDKLYRNVGDLKFEVVANAGVEDVGWGQAAGHTDFNGDGWQDLIVGNDFGVNGYYQNLKDGTFRDVSEVLRTDKPSYTMGIGIADLNRDDLPDIYISNIVTMNKDEKYVAPNRDTPLKFDPDKLANQRVVEANDLFISSRNDDGQLTYDHSDLVDRGYSSTGWSWDADFFDYDNDGDEDLYVLNGMNEFNVYGSENPYYTDPLQNEKFEVQVAQSNAERNVFFANDGGRLQNRSDGSGLDVISNARSAAYLDFDRDGFLDIAMNSYHGPVMLFRNTGVKGGRWLKIRLEGDPAKGASRDAVGARIVVDGERVRRLWREVHGTIGYLSVHPREQHFGVGDEKTVSISVTWPDGKVQQFENVTTNRSYRLKQNGKLLDWPMPARE